MSTVISAFNSLTLSPALSALLLKPKHEQRDPVTRLINLTLGWFFILGRGIVLAMELNAVIYERYGSISKVVFSLPFFRVLARKSARLRRFFGLQ